jgi:ribosomal protein S12 methylthiotransferase accessory factor
MPHPRDGLFDRNRPILWIEGQDLLADEPIWVPFEAVHTNFTLARWNQDRSFIASSNGLASGNHLLEAISHGICEVVERDASTLWSFLSEGAGRATCIDPQSVDDPDCRRVLEKFAVADIAVAMWETTSDIGIPAFECSIVDRAKGRLHRLYPASGSGCHPARHIALLRALLEAAQSRLTRITGARDDMYRREYEDLGSPDLFRAQGEIGGARVAGRPFPGSSWAGDTFEDDVAWELEKLRAAGIERAIVVDLTKPEFRVPVVRVVIPGLEFASSHDTYHPGRRARRVAELQS